MAPEPGEFRAYRKAPEMSWAAAHWPQVLCATHIQAITNGVQVEDQGEDAAYLSCLAKQRDDSFHSESEGTFACPKLTTLTNSSYTRLTHRFNRRRRG